MKRQCLKCGRIKGAKEHTCPLSAWNKGKTRAEDPRIAQPWLGKKRPDFAKWQTGRKFTKEHIENLKKSHLGNSGYWKGKKRLEMSGEKHFAWKGGEATQNKRKAFSQRKRKYLFLQPQIDGGKIKKTQKAQLLLRKLQRRWERKQQ